MIPSADGFSNERTAPASIEAEQALLGCLLALPDLFYDVQAMLIAEDFWLVKHAWIYEVIVKLMERNGTVDSLSVADELRIQNKLIDIGGLDYLTYIVVSYDNSLKVTVYAEIIRRAAGRRRILAASGDIAQMALEDNLEYEELKGNVWQTIDAVLTEREDSQLIDARQIANTARDQWLLWTLDPNPVRGLRSGLTALDYLLGGFKRDCMASLILKTSYGKTLFAGQLMMSLCQQGYGLVASTELTVQDVIHRLVTQRLRLGRMALRRGEQGDHIAAAYQWVSEQPIIFLDKGRPYLHHVKASLTRLKRTYGEQFTWAIVDSGNNVRVQGTKPGELYATTSAVSNELSGLARDLGVFIFVTWQANRDSYQQEAVSLNQGRGGGDIENDSEYVFTISRPEYSYITNPSSAPPGWTPNADGSERAKWHVLKDRNSGTAGAEIDVLYRPGHGFFGLEI